MRILQAEKVGDLYEVEVATGDGEDERRHTWSFGSVPLVDVACGATDGPLVCVIPAPHDDDDHEFGSAAAAPTPRPEMSERDWVEKNLRDLKERLEPSTPPERTPLDVPEEM